MPSGKLTLLDLTKRTRSDPEVGLVEELLTYSPELRTVPIRPIIGTTFKTTVRTNLPSGGFRGVNEGLVNQRSNYSQKLAQCFFLDIPMEVDEALVRAEGADSVGDLLADEASGAMMGAGLTIGTQFYYGVSANDKGFAGLLAQVDASMVISATGTGTRTGVYFVWEDIKGVHLVGGNQTSLAMSAWARQQLTQADDATKKYFGWVANASGWIGLAMGNSKSIAKVSNCTTSKPFTDALAAEALATFPIPIRQSGNIRCYMNRTAAFQLQKSRSTIGYTKDASRGEGYAPMPTEVQGVPITITDSIVDGSYEGT